MSCVLGIMAFIAIFVGEVIKFTLKIVFFPFTIFSIISAAETERKIEEIRIANQKNIEDQKRMKSFYKVKLDTFYDHRGYNDYYDFYVGDGKHLYLKESTMLPEDAVKYGYLPKKEAKAEYNKKMVEICKILNLPISLI